MTEGNRYHVLMDTRYMVLFGSFSMFSNFYRLHLHNKTRVASTKNYDETYAKTGLKIRPPML
jgi:hypothetical protein